jgi:hypothetical protein
MKFTDGKTVLAPRERLAAARRKDECYYRTRYEQSGKISWLLEYGLSPSAWQSPWFREVVRTKIIAFLQWCNSRGVSLGKIAKWLNDHGPSPSRGKAWYKSTVAFLLARSPASDEETNIRTLVRLLKGFGWAERNQQPGLDRVIESSESTEECARRVWDMHNLLLPAFRALSAYLVQAHREYERKAERGKGTEMHRRGEFAFRFLGISLKRRTLRDILQHAKSSSKETLAWVVELEKLDKDIVPDFLDFQPSNWDMELLGQHKTKEALLRILCKLERITTRTARRYRAHCVQ